MHVQRHTCIHTSTHTHTCTHAHRVSIYPPPIPRNSPSKAPPLKKKAAGGEEHLPLCLVRACMYHIITTSISLPAHIASYLLGFPRKGSKLHGQQHASLHQIRRWTYFSTADKMIHSITGSNETALQGQIWGRLCGCRITAKMCLGTFGAPLNKGVGSSPNCCSSTSFQQHKRCPL